ncbi:GNAT family N-acetyltransferase [Polaribacter sp. MSW13]|uniref:GNAT family N-acetyltransferase n=1 Tax=Polaribacter marinus TaxID=2916838 RepID=A0A9X1VN76_9FLAO|nr:GNAT family N-acetyltransferase [Polaribacter marinus]MCI2229629.1 GNAT family N-acetyltransferase [Polaribacter marinus]
MNFDFTIFPILETERLTLRALNLDDAKAIFGLRTNKSVNTFIKRDIPKNLSEARAFIDQISNLVSTNSGIFWVIESKQNKELIGTVGLRNFRIEEKDAEIGYELHPNYQEKGFMTETLKEVVNFGFKNLGLKTIEAFTHKNNMASIALLEKQDFVFQPERKDEGFDDNRIYSLAVIKNQIATT